MAQAISNDPYAHSAHAPRGRWPVRRSVIFVLAASAALWMLILLPAAAL
ncbi:hypothetical protein [Phenylobacterium sp.]|nr:hypothetical protein [Phenylobacterium sp.]MDP1872566.1 hypothetical protein [Phenylobacterium sp.]MDP3488583.1 hypothetical protein [Phenylobacterium sp.]